MPRLTTLALAVVLSALVTAPASAQRLPFERAFELRGPAVLDVSTVRGRIDVRVGEPGRIVVSGTATIRTGWDVPANAADLARAVVDHPPLERDGSTVRVRPPAGAAERRAVTVSYRVVVPPDTQVSAVSESGATTVQGVAGAVTVRTQSGAIVLTQLGGGAGVTSGSGSVTVDGVGGALTVTTSSSAFVGRALHDSVRVRTGSGTVDATLAGDGDADIETGSSAIRVRGINGALRAVTRSGRVSVEGRPASDWDVSTGSGGVDIAVDPAASFSLRATSGSGSATLEGAEVQGATSKRSVAGSIAGGGPLVRVNSRSGAVRIRVAPSSPAGQAQSDPASPSRRPTGAPPL
jgi:hypothetical protein